MKKTACLLCASSDVKKLDNSRLSLYDIELYHCEVCGDYGVTEEVKEDFIMRNKNSFSEKAPYIAVERKLAGNDKYVLCLNDNPQRMIEGTKYYFLPVSEFLEQYPVPEEIFDRVLINLGYLLKHPAAAINLKELNLRQDSKWFLYANDQILISPQDNDNKNLLQERKTIILSSLREAGYISIENEGRSIIITSNHLLRITEKGWKRIASLKKKQETKKNTAFVAMWFDESTRKYREAVRCAIKSAGYKPKIIDEEKFNDFIMDKIINYIKGSRFIIADFTCQKEKYDTKNKFIGGGVRGGIYYEAGFAAGLEKPVIYTCKDDSESKDRRHFDIQQIYTIFWKEDNSGNIIVPSLKNKSLEEVLREHILATVGKGNVEIKKYI